MLELVGGIGESIIADGTVTNCLIDVWAAFISGKTTLIPTHFWVDDMSIKSVMTKGNVDDYCNLAILIFAEIINLLHTDKGYRPALATSVSSLWDELQKWYQLRPQEVCPLLRDSLASSKVFPTIVYTHASSSESSLFWFMVHYHTDGMILRSLRQYFLSYWFYFALADGASPNSYRKFFVSPGRCCE